MIIIILFIHEKIPENILHKCIFTQIWQKYTLVYIEKSRNSVSTIENSIMAK